MKDEVEIYKVMLELAEEENDSLYVEINTLQTLVETLTLRNKQLERRNEKAVLAHNNLLEIEKRLN